MLKRRVSLSVSSLVEVRPFLADASGYEGLVQAVVEVFRDIVAHVETYVGLENPYETLEREPYSLLSKWRYETFDPKFDDRVNHFDVNARKELDSLCNAELYLASLAVFMEEDPLLLDALSDQSLQLKEVHETKDKLSQILTDISHAKPDGDLAKWIQQCRRQSLSSPGVHYRPDVNHVFENQDSFYVNPKGVFGVFDGVSRSDTPQLASQTMVRLCDERLPGLVDRLNEIVQKNEDTIVEDCVVQIRATISVLLQAFKDALGASSSATTGAIWLTLCTGHRIGLFFGDASAFYCDDNHQLYLNPITYNSDWGDENELLHLDETSWPALSLEDVIALKEKNLQNGSCSNPEYAGINNLNSDIDLQPCIVFLTPSQAGEVSLVSDQFPDNIHERLMHRAHEDPATFGAMVDVVTMTYVRLGCVSRAATKADKTLKGKIANWHRSLSSSWGVDKGKWGDDATLVAPHLIKERMLPSNLLIFNRD